MLYLYVIIYIKYNKKGECIVMRNKNKKIETTKSINEDNEEIISELTLIEEKEGYDESKYSSTFHYKVKENSELFTDGKASAVVISIKHKEPIDYKEFHEDIMIHNWALNMLGYDMIEDSDIWMNKLYSENDSMRDEEFINKFDKFVDTIIPISEEEYNDIMSKEK